MSEVVNVGQEGSGPGCGSSHPPLFASSVRRIIDVVTAVAALLAVTALGTLAVRAAVRLELRWDTFLYHMPFAAMRGGVTVPYDMSDAMSNYFLGFPPLAHIVQGTLWRLTGSINATGVVNLGAFLAFLAFCHMKLQARFWFVALIALTAPMVLIHTTVSYVDLFSNALLAIGVCAFVRMFLFDEQDDRVLLLCGLFGLAGAAWSKYQLVPVAALFLMLFLLTYAVPAARAVKNRRVMLIWIGVMALVAALPYLKNWAMYGNPFWPVRVPIVGGWLTFEPDTRFEGIQYPPHFALGKFERFFRSLFEIGVPTSYQARVRWIIDQGGTYEGFRIGGFWHVAVVVNLVSVVAMGIVHNLKKGLLLALGGALALGFVAILPNSDFLRYYLLVPLCLAAIIGMLFPVLRRRYDRVALCQLLLVVSLFLYMTRANWHYYTVEKMDYAAAADAWGASEWWSRLSPEQTYCVVDMAPMGMLMTGPTMSEFQIIDRTDRSLCPTDSVVIDRWVFVD